MTEFVQQGEHLFAATGSHGLWRSDDDARTWRRLEGCKVAEFSALAVTEGLVVAGTLKQGVLLSRDRGETWVSANQGLSSLKTRRLLAVGKRTFLGTNAGLFVYEEGHSSWTHLTGDLQVKGIASAGRDLYLGDVSGVQRSSDGGATWTRILEETPHNLAVVGDSLYALLYSGSVKRSDDGGATWQDVSRGLPELYTFQILPASRGALAAQWDGVYVRQVDAWHPLRVGLPPGTAITDLLQLANGRLVAAAVPRRTN
ncbi:MAG: hypothetical protein AB7K71_00815 [Polyangiaceae bacterium]